MNPSAKKFLLATVAASFAYGLCLFYSCLVALHLAYRYVRERETRFWVGKPHSKPAALSDPAYGEHKYITVNGVKLHCVIKGPAGKPLMLFIHGFPEFWYSWRHQITEFSRDYRTVAVDMRGYGDSDKPTGLAAYRMENMIEDIRQLIVELGYERCTLVCHDWGAVVGWSFVERHMPMVDRYVMMGAPSSPVWRRSIASSLNQFTKSWYVFFFQMPWLPEFLSSLDDLRLLKMIGVGGQGGRIDAEDLEAYKYTFGQPGALTTPINWYRANLRFFNVFKRTKVDKYAPGLFLLGEKDAFIAQTCGAEQVKESGNLRFESIVGANHFLQQDAPKETNAAIRKFLAEK